MTTHSTWQLLPEHSNLHLYLQSMKHEIGKMRQMFYGSTDFSDAFLRILMAEESAMYTFCCTGTCVANDSYIIMIFAVHTVSVSVDTRCILVAIKKK